MFGRLGSSTQAVLSNYSAVFSESKLRKQVKVPGNLSPKLTGIQFLNSRVKARESNYTTIVVRFPDPAASQSAWEIGRAHV